MRAASDIRWQRELGADFEVFVIGHRRAVLHREIAPEAASLLEHLDRLDLSGEPGAGNRRSAHRLLLDSGTELFARRALRGGLTRFLLRDLYLGANPRVLRELAVAAQAHRRGVPVAEPMGAVVDWIAPTIYRGIFLTRASPGLTLWEFLQHSNEPAVRGQVLLRVRSAIEMMHQRGLFHADLNLCNLIISQLNENFSVIILDLDKARLYEGPLTPAMRRKNLNRLLRSARKLDPEGRVFDKDALVLLGLD